MRLRLGGYICLQAAHEGFENLEAPQRVKLRLAQDDP
jgi:hypothetical protein